MAMESPTKPRQATSKMSPSEIIEAWELVLKHTEPVDEKRRKWKPRWNMSRLCREYFPRFTTATPISRIVEDRGIAIVSEASLRPPTETAPLRDQIANLTRQTHQLETLIKILAERVRRIETGGVGATYQPPDTGENPLAHTPFTISTTPPPTVANGPGGRTAHDWDTPGGLGERMAALRKDPEADA